MTCCEKFIPLMSDYIDGDLTSEEKDLLDVHFKDCEKCRTFFQSFRNSIQLIEFLEINTCPPEVKDRLSSIITKKIEQKKFKDHSCE